MIQRTCTLLTVTCLLLWGIAVPSSGGEKEDEKIGLPVENKKLTKMSEKIVRGMVYILDNKFIETPYHISIYPYNKEVLREILENIHPGPWEVYERPPGLAVLRALVAEDKTSGIYLIDIWGQYYSVAFVSC